MRLSSRCAVEHRDTSSSADIIALPVSCSSQDHDQGIEWTLCDRYLWSSVGVPDRERPEFLGTTPPLLLLLLGRANELPCIRPAEPIYVRRRLPAAANVRD